MIGYHIRETLRGLAVLLFLAALIVVGLRILAGCTPAEDPSAQRRAVVLTIANGMVVGDKACASVARAKGGEEGYRLALACAFAYDAARLSLVTADEKLDKEAPEDVSCEVEQALDYARQMAGLIEKYGGKLPRALADALRFAALVGTGCAG